jgi:hypothetical protein
MIQALVDMATCCVSCMLCFQTDTIAETPYKEMDIYTKEFTHHTI